MLARRDALRRGMPVLVALGGGIGLGACRGQPIYQSTGGQFPGRGNMAEREAQIRRAAASQGGWQIQSMRSGLLRGTNTWRSHQMAVDISFDVRTFSITYVNSVNLDYAGGQIHSSYNARVRALESAILRSGPAAAAGGGGGGPVSRAPEPSLGPTATAGSGGFGEPGAGVPAATSTGSLRGTVP